MPWRSTRPHAGGLVNATPALAGAPRPARARLLLWRPPKPGRRRRVRTDLDLEEVLTELTADRARSCPRAVDWIDDVPGRAGRPPRDHAPPAT